MIKFDPTLFRCDYVKLKKITSGYLYVTETNDGKTYSTNTSTKAKYRGREVTKIKVHESVARQYFKHHSMKEFKGLGKFACIAYYGDIAVAVEVQNQLIKRDEGKDWVATIEKIMSNITMIIPPQKDVYINGKEIFWLSDHPANATKQLRISEDESFYLKYVKYLSLSKIGVEVNTQNKEKIANGQMDDDNIEDIVAIKTIGSSRNISKDSIKYLNFDENYASYDENSTHAIAFLKESLVLSYSPNRMSEKPIECFSPILSFDENISQIKNEKDTEKTIEFLRSIESPTDPIFLNLNFALHSGKTIGQLYGYEETDILRISDIIRKTKVISLEKIYPESRSGYPIELPVKDGLAWLFRFIHKENDINAMRELSTLFLKVFKTGFIWKSKVESIFKSGKTEDDIQLLKYTPKY